MHGRTCLKHKDGEKTTYKALPHICVWRFLRPVPLEVELRVRRLKLLQSMLRSLEVHAQGLIALIGRMKFQRTTDSEEPITKDGSPWSQQLVADIASLRDFVK